MKMKVFWKPWLDKAFILEPIVEVGVAVENARLSYCKEI
jgi:hypothetical protein